MAISLLKLQITVDSWRTLPFSEVSFDTNEEVASGFQLASGFHVDEFQATDGILMARDEPDRAMFDSLLVAMRIILRGIYELKRAAFALELPEMPNQHMDGRAY